MRDKNLNHAHIRSVVGSSTRPEFERQLAPDTLLILSASLQSEDAFSDTWGFIHADRSLILTRKK